jgi:RNA polymerase sigma-70 factor, ECF subfamily
MSRPDPPAGAGAGDPDDRTLLRAHLDGDAEAFGTLFARHRDRLWAVALRTTGDPEDAADALQDALVAAFRRAESFRGDSAVTTWLHRIVVNACLDRMRRRAVRPAASTGGEQALDTLALGHAVPDPSAASDTALDVHAALRTLPPEQQAALVLVDMLGYPVADAAEVLGISQGTVKSRCARARAKLVPQLAHLRRAASQTGPARNQTATGNVSPAQGGGDSPQ